MIPRRGLLVLFALGMASACANPAATRLPAQDPGKLAKATKAVTGDGGGAGGSGNGGSGNGGSPGAGGGAASKSAGRSSSSWLDDDEEDSLVAELLKPVFGLLVHVVGIPLIGPHRNLENVPGAMHNGYYRACPYADDEGVHIADARVLGDERRPWALRVVGDYGNDFAGLERFGANVRLDTAVRVGLDASWSHFREDLPSGGSDTIDLGDVNLVYRFAQGDVGEMRAGLGMNWYGAGPVDEYGFNATYAGDFYPHRPWVLSFELDYGQVGAATRFHGRLTAGAQWGRGEVFAGFDFESLDSVGLPTWTVGLRWWF